MDDGDDEGEAEAGVHCGAVGAVLDYVVSDVLVRIGMLKTYFWSPKCWM